MILTGNFQMRMRECCPVWSSAQIKAPGLGLLFGSVVLGCLLSAGASAVPAEPAVKRSGSGICHDQNSPSYVATKRFKSYDSLEQCLKAGGRLPKNLPHEKPQRDAESQEDSGDRAGANPKLIMILLAGAAVACAGGAWLCRRRTPQENLEEALARRKWEGHRLESSDDEIFKRRPHRWDPWLKRVGYFDKNKKP